jgi:hypothetical protein
MNRTKILSISASVVLAIFTCLLLYFARERFGKASSDAQLEALAGLLLAVLSAFGGVYLAFFNESVATETALLEGLLARMNSSAENTEKLSNDLSRVLAEGNARSANSYLDLEYQEEFRKRERRDKALLGISEALIRCTRAFVALTTFRLAKNEPTESLVNVLAQALAARATFLDARENLLVLKAIKNDHSKVLREYSLLLIDIIIDVRRRDDVTTTGANVNGYITLMEAHGSKLRELDQEIGDILTVFLAPRYRKAAKLDKALKPNID